MNLSHVTTPLHVVDANLSGSTFEDVNFSNSTVINARLHQVRFEDVDFSGTQLTKVNMSHVQIDDCVLTSMTINGILVEEMLAAYNARSRE